MYMYEQEQPTEGTKSENTPVTPKHQEGTEKPPRKTKNREDPPLWNIPQFFLILPLYFRYVYW